MIFNQTTQVPNILFDQHLPNLTGAEVKILLIIIRQTIGWIDKSTGNRKTRDRITQSQFRIKTGLAPRIISKTLKMLSDKDLIAITDQNNQPLKNSLDRKGKSILYYALNPVHFSTSTSAQSDIGPMHKSAYNKRKKETITKGSGLPIWQNNAGTIDEIIKLSKYQSLLRF